jgi:hypothetical protein
VGQFAQSHGAGHARAAFEGVQAALQVASLLGISRIVTPCAQGAADLRIELVGLFQKDGQ